MLSEIMNQAPAAPELINDLVCSLSPQDCGNLCKCFINQQQCTAAYNCVGLTGAVALDEIDICANPLKKAVMFDYDSDQDLPDT